MRYACVFVALFCFLSLTATNIPTTPGALAENPSTGILCPPASRTAPSYQFHTEPTVMQYSLYDDLPGGPLGNPIAVQDCDFHGAYCSYLYQESSTSIYRFGYCYNDFFDTLNPSPNSIFNGVGNIACDPETGNALMAWTEDIDADGIPEVRFNFDNFYSAGSAGFLANPFTLIDNGNPGDAFNPPYDDDVFVQPLVFVSYAPTYDDDHLRRVYVVAFNQTSHAGENRLAENPIIVYADFSNADFELNNWSSLDWHYATIPQMDAWNAGDPYIRPLLHSVAINPNGKLAVIGYVTGDDVAWNDPEMYVFYNDNYGDGGWQFHRFNAQQFITDIPNGPDGQPLIAATNVCFDFKHSQHATAAWGNDNHLHLPANFALTGTDPDTGERIYYPWFSSVRDLVWSPNSPDTLYNIDLWPKGAYPNDNHPALPWDNNEDGLVDNDGQWHVVYTVDWPIFQWDADQGDAMNLNQIASNEDRGWMAILWTDGTKCRLYRQDGNADYADWTTAPEMYIEMSWDGGGTWTDPISLNALETPELNGMIPEFAYLGNHIEVEGPDENGHLYARLHLGFYDDHQYGTDYQCGGNLMYASLDVLSPDDANDDHTPHTPSLSLYQNWPNPFNPTTTIAFSLPQAGHTTLQVYNLRGQRVKTLVDAMIPAGEQSVTWDGTDASGHAVASGVYLYRLSSASETSTREMLLLK